MGKKVFYRSTSFIHFSRSLTLSKEQAILVKSEHLPALHLDIERVRVNNLGKEKGGEVGGVLLFEKEERKGILSMVVEGGKGKVKEVLPLKKGEWLTVPAFEFHNAFTSSGEQELEIAEPALTGAISIFHDGKAKLDVKLLENRTKKLD
jgi:hypothetical protein